MTAASAFFQQWTSAQVIRLAAIGLATCTFLSGCTGTDDQRLIPPEQFAEANPAFPAIDAAAQAKHQILVAILDTGVDYLHPALRDRMHYRLGANGTTPALGHDFIGGDFSPAPYLIRTEHLRSGASDKLLKQEQAWLEGTDWVLAEHPEYASFIGRHRLHLLEKKLEIYRGTHVAGLASFGDERIGILPYRILPFNREAATDFDYDTRVITDLIAAIEAADRDGARIVHFSFSASVSSENSRFQKLKDLETQLAQAIASRPKLAFVAALGSEDRKIDGVTSRSLPCSLDLPNLICVGALTKNRELLPRSDLIDTKTPTVYAIGDQIRSVMPTAYCDSDAVSYLPAASATSATNQGQTPEQLQETRKNLLNKLISGCAGLEPFAELSGPSVAAPLVARTLAKQLLKRPEQTGAEVIQALVQTADAERFSGFSVHKVKVEVPKTAR